MTRLHVFPPIRQARFEAKRTAMKFVYYSCVVCDDARASEVLADAEREIDVALRSEGVPASSRRAALAEWRRDLAELIRRNGGDAPERSVR